MFKKFLFASCSLLVTSLLFTNSVVAVVLAGQEDFYGRPPIFRGMKEGLPGDTARLEDGEKHRESSQPPKVYDHIDTHLDMSGIEKGILRIIRSFYRVGQKSDPLVISLQFPVGMEANEPRHYGAGGWSLPSSSTSNAAAAAEEETESLFDGSEDETLLKVLSFLGPRDLGLCAQASTRFRRISVDGSLWRNIGLEHYPGYFQIEDLRKNPREKVIKHYLSVLVHKLDNLEEGKRIVTKYGLDLPYSHFRDGSLYRAFFFSLLDAEQRLVSEEMETFALELFPYLTFRAALCTDMALSSRRGISGRISLHEAAMEVLEHQGKTTQSWELLDDKKLWTRSLAETQGLIESDATRGDREALRFKWFGVFFGGESYGSLKAIKRMIESHASEGDEEALRFMIDGLTDGRYGFKENVDAARRVYNERLSKEQQRAFSFCEGGKTIEHTDNLFHSGLSYKEDPEGARDMNESFIAQEDPYAVLRKIEGLARGRYGYERDLELLGPLLETLTASKIPTFRAIGHFFKAYGLKYGIFGFKKDRDAARDYILEHHVPF